MIYAKLQVASLRTVEDISHTGQDIITVDSGKIMQLNGRLSVLDDSISRHAFDTVQLNFRGEFSGDIPIASTSIEHTIGIIASTVGGKFVLEDIVTLTDVKTSNDFQASSIPGKDLSIGKHANFFFNIPRTAHRSDGTVRTLPLSSIISGVSSVTQRGTLSDRKIIPGECEVSYWIHAQFRCAGREVGSLNEPVRISSLYSDLRLSLSKGLPMNIRAPFDMISRLRFTKAPELTLSLYEPDVAINYDPASGKRTAVIPLAVAMDLEALASGWASFDGRQSFKCTVEAKWKVNTRFSIAPMRSSSQRLKPTEAVHKTTTASTQKSIILFRPLPGYQEDCGLKFATSKSYVATSQLELLVPGSVSQPSLRWDYLSRGYSLDLRLKFHGIQGAPKYSLQTTIPVTVLECGSRPEEESKDEIVVHVAEVDDQDQTPQRIPMASAPPPLYFR
jgi:hypothetical protein